VAALFAAYWFALLFIFEMLELAAFGTSAVMIQDCRQKCAEVKHILCYHEPYGI
jgi:hypothetical protein